MNPDTRIVVSCFSGDKQQLDQYLDLYTHHECPILILSPEDAPVVINHPLVTNRHAGHRARSGPVSHARMLEYLKVMLTFPERFFMINESDSMCLDPKIPGYLYEEPDTFWCNIEESPQFVSRRTVERMVEHSPGVVGPVEWCDRYMIALAKKAGVPVKTYRKSLLGPLSGRYNLETGQLFTPFGAEAFGSEENEPLSPKLAKFYDDNFVSGTATVRSGVPIVHSVKNGNAAHSLLATYNLYLAEQETKS